MRAVIVRTVFLTLMILCLMVVAQASPDFATYQGVLTDDAGQAVPDSTHQVQFRLYTVDVGGTPFVAFPTQNVQTHGGLFTAQIGPITPYDLIGKTDVWLETLVALPPAPLQALSPRAKLVSVPYALVVPWSGVEGAPSSFPPSGSAGGDLIGAYPAPSIKSSAITSAKIADGTITNTDISPSAAIADTKIAGTGTVVTNLNADRLDGLNASDLAATSGSPIKQVVRGTIDFSLTNYDVTQTFSPAVNPAKCIVELTGPVNTGASSSAFERRACLMSLTASQIRIVVDRVIPSGVSYRVGYQIVEYN